MAKLPGRAWKMRRGDWMRIAGLIGVLALLVGVAFNFPRITAHAATGDWSTYQGGLGRTGFNADEIIINKRTAPNLKIHWTNQAASTIVSQPVVVNNTVYWGSWDGLEHATDAISGMDIWTQNLGQTAGCTPKHPRGVTSTATITTLQINGSPTTAVIVGGGNSTMYALDASNGNIIWQTRLGSSPDHFIYSSPAVYNGNIFVGVSSYNDCPKVQGKVVMLDATSGIILHTFFTAPTGCQGGGIWGSPAINDTTGILFIATGDLGHCKQAEPYVSSVLAFSTVDLSLIGSWQAHNLALQQDYDFGTTPTLFDATISGILHHMLGLANKRGIYYAFDQSNISAGPLWKVRIAMPGGSPELGLGSISSSAWDGEYLYVAGSATTVNGVNCAGSIRAVNPTKGNFVWKVCLNATVLGAIIAVPGLVILGSGNTIYVLDSSTGIALFTYQDMTSGTSFDGAASVSNGVLYDGGVDGILYTFGL